MIGEEIVGVSLGVVGHGWVKAGIVGHCLVMMFGVGGHFVEVAVIVECWEEEEEGFEEEVVVSYLVGVEESGGGGE